MVTTGCWRRNATPLYVCVSVCAAGNFPMIADDLVNSYHLLLCCLDLVFSNASLCSHRANLINPAFTGRRGNLCFSRFKMVLLSYAQQLQSSRWQ